MEVWCAHALGSGHRTNIGAAVLLVGDPVQDDFDVDMYSRHDEQYKSTLISKFSKIICIQSLVGPAKCEKYTSCHCALGSAGPTRDLHHVPARVPKA